MGSLRLCVEDDGKVAIDRNEFPIRRHMEPQVIVRRLNSPLVEGSTDLAFPYVDIDQGPVVLGPFVHGFIPFGLGKLGIPHS